MAVPTFNAESSGNELGASARSYLRQVDAWTEVTRLPQDQRALVLHQHLQGRAWLEAEELDVETLASTQGMSVFRRWVQERYQEIEVSKIAEALTQFFRHGNDNLDRQSGSSTLPLTGRAAGSWRLSVGSLRLQRHGMGPPECFEFVK